jgi:hypothetical protein
MSKARTLFTYKEWRLRRSDPKNLVIERKSLIKDKKTGKNKEVWQFEGFYSNFQSAINSLADKIGFNADSLDGAITEIREMRQTVERLMKGQE